jgi:peptide/nickel transport system permease protein
MTVAILKRVGQALVSLFAVIVIVFLLTQVTGDPAFFLTGPEATEADREQLRERLGLNRPLYEQFGDYMLGILQGDLGDSLRTLRPVSDTIALRLPATLQMAAAAFLLTIVVAVPLGVLGAYWRGGIVDRIARTVAALGQAMPSFWVGLLLILGLAVSLHWLPSGGYGSPAHLVLPAITLSLGAIAGLTRLLRSSMIEVLSADYVTFHRIKGVPEHEILWKHGLRNAGLTALTYLGIITAGLLGGSVLVETVFVWPGVGRLMVDSIQVRDYTMVLGLMLLFGGTYIFMNLIVDVLYTVLNPRLRGNR